jgi:hypothetical protein
LKLHPWRFKMPIFLIDVFIINSFN